MLVTLKNDFHNTTARVRYPGGVHPIPESALRKLCPFRGCYCWSTRAGEPYALQEGVRVAYNWMGWVLVPAEE